MEDNRPRARLKERREPRQARLPLGIEDEPGRELEPRSWRELLNTGAATMARLWPVIDCLGEPRRDRPPRA